MLRVRVPLATPSSHSDSHLEFNLAPFLLVDAFCVLAFDVLDLPPVYAVRFEKPA